MQSATALAIVLMALLTLDRASAQSCGTLSTLPNENSDRSWIKSDATLYSAGTGNGISRIRLSSNQAEPIGDHRHEDLYDFQIFPDHTKLYYSFQDRKGRMSDWIYDIADNREMRIEDLTGKETSPSDSIEISPDSRAIALAPMWGDGAKISIVDLQSSKVRTFPLPIEQKQAVMFGLGWSYAGDETLIGSRSSAGDELFWSVDRGSGRVENIQGARVGNSLQFLRDGTVIGEDSVLCGRPRSVKSINLPSGVTVFMTDTGELIESVPGGLTRSIAKSTPNRGSAGSDGTLVISSCGDKQVVLSGSFSDRYIIYSIEGDYWIYGVEEDRKVHLDVGPFVVW